MYLNTEGFTPTFEMNTKVQFYMQISLSLKFISKNKLLF